MPPTGVSHTVNVGQSFETHRRVDFTLSSTALTVVRWDDYRLITRAFAANPQQEFRCQFQLLIYDAAGNATVQGERLVILDSQTPIKLFDQSTYTFATLLPAGAYSARIRVVTSSFAGSEGSWCEISSRGAPFGRSSHLIVERYAP
jgi:hypothetical protein